MFDVRLLDLVMEYVPRGYKSTFLLDRLEVGLTGVVGIRVLHVRYGRGMLSIDALAPDFSALIKVNIFNATRYHRDRFSLGSSLFVSGKIARSDLAPMVINNPKIVSKVNVVTPIFKSNKLKYERVQSDITEGSLLNSHVPPDVVSHLLDVFYPSKAFFDLFDAQGCFPREHLDSIKFVEMMRFMLKFGIKRRFFRSKFRCLGDETEFVESLPFNLTDSQRQVISDIKKDLCADVASKRIIMGDVGCGKTIVILASVVMTYPHRSILMVPTTVLATQLFHEASRLMPKHIKIKLVISGTPKRDELDADFIIGTQALLYRDFDPDDFALVMTDEQHRFGTKERHRLEQTLQMKDSVQHSNHPESTLDSTDMDPTPVSGMDSGTADVSKSPHGCESEHASREERGRLDTPNVTDNATKDAHIDLCNRLVNHRVYGDIKKPHALQFSATPIPRSMSLIHSNIVDYSFMRDLPFKKDITTRIISKNDLEPLVSHIRDEVDKSNQVAIIYPLVHESKARDYIPLEEGKNYWIKRFEHVFFTHGKDRQKEKILDSFSKTRGSILLATTMIEVGISIPHLSIIVIVGAEFLGLASLHQLRGRVSRNGLPGFCYLLTNDVGNKRLVDFSKTLDGFQIAELDLDYRDSGDLLDGYKQSGSMFSYASMKDTDIIKRVNDLLKGA